MRWESDIVGFFVNITKYASYRVMITNGILHRYCIGQGVQINIVCEDKDFKLRTTTVHGIDVIELGQ